MPLLILFHKKARSARLFACKRAHGRLTVATTFLRVCLRQANVAIVRRIYTPNTVPLMPLLLLFRKGRARLTAIAVFLIVSAHTRFLHDFIYEKNIDTFFNRLISGILSEKYDILP